MERKKLKIDELKVKSFITHFKTNDSQTFEGGHITYFFILTTVLYFGAEPAQGGAQPVPLSNFTCGHVGCPLSERVNCPSMPGGVCGE